MSFTHTHIYVCMCIYIYTILPKKRKRIYISMLCVVYSRRSNMGVELWFIFMGWISPGMAWHSPWMEEHHPTNGLERWWMPPCLALWARVGHLTLQWKPIKIMGLFYVPTKATASLDTQMIGWMTNACAYILAMMGGDTKYMTSPKPLCSWKQPKLRAQIPILCCMRMRPSIML